MSKLNLPQGFFSNANNYKELSSRFEKAIRNYPKYFKEVDGDLKFLSDSFDYSVEKIRKGLANGYINRSDVPNKGGFRTAIEVVNAKLIESN